MIDASQGLPAVMFGSLALLSTIVTTVPSVAQPAAGLAVQVDDCRSWQDCRDQGLAAAADGDFERFHDLAWRAVQKGPKNDPALLTLLARAQSLSGRPHDALVMLQRLAAMGVIVDVDEGEDFRRIRALAAWKAWQAQVNGPAPAPSGGGGTSTIGPAKPPSAVRAATSNVAEPSKLPGPKESAASEPATTRSMPEDERAEGNPADALRFTTVPFTPAGLAYDAVSNRFILGDRLEQKLTVVGERSQRPVNLTGTESGGFGFIEAITIDVHEGDLWVASTPEGEQPAGKLHKLQLVSGRLLSTAALPEAAAGARLTDIEVTPRGDLLALDSAGGRLFGLSPRSKEIALISTLDVDDPVSIAPAQNDVVYVAGSKGLSLFSGRQARPVQAAGKIDLTGLAWIRWRRGGLIGVQRSSEGLYRIVRIRLDASGRRATGLEVIEKAVAMASPSSVAMTDATLYYLARDTRYSATEGMDLIIRRVRLGKRP